MKRLALAMLIAALAAAWLPLRGEDDKSLLDEAKLQIFEKNWSEALHLLDEGLQLYPSTPLLPSYLFYRAKCLEELKQWKLALVTYDEFLRISKNANLHEEAQSSQIDIAFELYQKGERDYIKQVQGMLKQENRALRYYAAFKLSYCKEKEIATAALPVLERIMSEESDTELRDKAKLAILRIDPRRLSGTDSRTPPGHREGKVRFLVIEVRSKGMPNPTVVRVPLSLADLALKSLDTNTKKAMRDKGYDIDQVLAKISDKAGLLLEVQDKDETVRIWIE